MSGGIMRLVTINSKYLSSYKVDPEMLQKSNRPCALIVQLKYKGHRYDFAVPLRSTIHPSTPKDQYFPLPPRHTTQANHRHGIHYIKLFPVKKAFLLRFREVWNVYINHKKRDSAESLKGCL